jgi:hypothetical protein
MSKTLFDKIRDNIVIVRLDNTSNDIIGILLDSNEVDISLGNPFFVNIQEGSMFPYCFLSDEKVFKFTTKKIEFIVPCNDKFKEEYINVVINKDISDNKPEEVKQKPIYH